MIAKYQLLKDGINHLIQKSELDIGAIYFILKDIFNEIEFLYYGQINKELLENNNSQEGEK